MKIQVKKIHLFNGTSKVKASADITIGGQITIYGCSIIEKNDGGKFVSMPQRKDKNDEKKYWSIVWIESKELTEAIRAAVMAEYEKMTGEAEAPGAT